MPKKQQLKFWVGFGLEGDDIQIWEGIEPPVWVQSFDGYRYWRNNSDVVQSALAQFCQKVFFQAFPNLKKIMKPRKMYEIKFLAKLVQPRKTPVSRFKPKPTRKPKQRGKTQEKKVKKAGKYYPARGKLYSVTGKRICGIA